MKIIKAKQAGFCYGVKRATRIALDLETQGDSQINTLGPLMHNPQEVARLAAHGIIPRDKIEDCVGGKTIIRTHGITRQELERAESLGIDLVDAICPYVKVPKNHIDKFCTQGRAIFLVGDQGHPEVVALLSFAKGEVFVVGDPTQIPQLDSARAVGVVAQTTQSREVFDEIVARCRMQYADTKAVYTVCEDTEKRQNEGREMAGKVDLMIVVGGRNSANTCRLTDICKLIQPRTHHIECVAELDLVSFRGVDSVGLVSGASTPDWIIGEIEQWLGSKSK
jgi:4-hydroxy-3-methylbut-2-en-1-yl diphosphate reductase